MSEKPYHPAKYTDQDIAAIQCVFEGIATKDQQRRAMDWIVNNVCGYYDLSFYPGEGGGRRETDFAEGKRYCAAQIVKMLKLKVGEQNANREK